jgi:hypothetical protein
MKKSYWIILILIGFGFCIYFFAADKIVYAINCRDLDYSEKLKNEDIRNQGIEISVCYKSITDRSIIVIQMIKLTNTNSRADVFRYLLQLAEKLSDKNFTKVEFAYKGISKFYLKGEDFRALGKEYNVQNPMYTIRTFPEKLKKLDGSSAYETWTGGIFGVLEQQMKDFTDFHDKWYWNDITNNK